MSELKTKVNDGDVATFIRTASEGQKQLDSFALLELYTEITGKQPKLWGTSIVGFDMYHYKSERSSQEGDWPMVGFSPRKQNITLYFMDGFEKHTELLGKLGKHKVSVGCLYLNKLSDIDITILKQLIVNSYHAMQKQYNK